MFKSFFKKQKAVNDIAEELIPVPVPALVAVLLNQEREKGAVLTKSEVCQTRDKAACIMMPVSVIAELEKSRGYSDINPENAWEDWQEARLVLIEN